MAIYAGIDLHSSNNYLALIDESGKLVKKRRLANQMEEILEMLSPYREELSGVVVESTYNWYWLVDGLMEAGYCLHLANPVAMRKYSGLKHSDDSSDAIWLADLLRLKILPEGYIYPKESRSLRDLLRKRGHLVRLRTGLLLSLQSMITRTRGLKIKSKEIKRKTGNHPYSNWGNDPELSLIAEVSGESIECLTRQTSLIEKAVEQKLKPHEEYRQLLTIPGVGLIIGMTITLETGPIERFARVGNYTSYCRKVNSQWTSNDKVKGSGNKKNGNKYLAWAFSEAAECSRRHNQACRSFYNRKLNQKNRMLAHSALAHKLARAAYYIMRDKVPFNEEKLFS